MHIYKCIFICIYLYLHIFIHIYSLKYVWWSIFFSQITSYAMTLGHTASLCLFVLMFLTTELWRIFTYFVRKFDRVPT